VGCGPAQPLLAVPNVTHPTHLNGQCINLISFDVALQIPLHSKAVM